LECIFLSDLFVAPLKYHFSRYSNARTGATFTMVQPYGIAPRPSEEAVARMLTGIFVWARVGRKGFRNAGRCVSLSAYT
jgi:hypothetical protein